MIRPLQEQRESFTCQCDACLLAPGSFPDEDGGFGPDPSAHGDASSKHGEQVDLLHHETGTVLDGAFWDWLVCLRGDGHVGFTPEGRIADVVSHEGKSAQTKPNEARKKRSRW